MAGIQEYLDLIKNAIYGKDVRQAIHDGILQCYLDASGDHYERLDRNKVNQPLDDNNQPINGTSGQSLRTKGDGTTEWASVGLPTDAQTAQAVSDWLDDHPEATTTVQDGSLTTAKYHDGSITVPKINASVWNKIDSDINDAMSNGIAFEMGSTANDVYTIFTIPKEKFEMSLELVSGNPNTPATIHDYVLREKPYLCMNISNTEDFIHAGQLYGTDYVQNQHGSIYALKSDSVDFDVFENGTRLSNLISADYVSAIAGWNCLRLDGVDKTVDWDYETYATPQPRQTLCWDDDNWYIYSSYARISYAGRNQMTNVIGKTMREILNFCKAKGWSNVIALDGGGSTYVASGDPFRQLSPNINNGYYRDAYMCIAFNLK